MTSLKGSATARALPPDQCLAWIVEFNATAMLTAGDSTVTAALRARTDCDEENGDIPHFFVTNEKAGA